MTTSIYYGYVDYSQSKDFRNALHLSVLSKYPEQAQVEEGQYISFDSDLAELEELLDYFESDEFVHDLANHGFVYDKKSRRFKTTQPTVGDEGWATPACG